MDKEYINNNYCKNCGYGSDPYNIEGQLEGSIYLPDEEPEEGDEVYEDEYIYPNKKAKFYVYIDTDYDNPDKEYDEDLLDDENRQAAIDALKKYKSEVDADEEERYDHFKEALQVDDDWNFSVKKTSEFNCVEEGFLIAAYDYLREEMYKQVVRKLRNLS